MNTIKIPDKKNVLMVAHRGVSGLERENTNAAFVAAGNRSYYGVETDIRRTADGKFVLFHDNTTKRIGIDNITVGEATYDTLRQMVLTQKNTEKKGRNDIRISTLEEYVDICQHYEKVCVLELKGPMTKSEINAICDTIEEMGYLDSVVFISFYLSDLILLRERYPKQPMQFLFRDMTEDIYQDLLKYHLDVDIYYKGVTKEIIDRCHADGIKVNCWTVDTIEEAEYVIDCGVDYITSNILE